MGRRTCPIEKVNQELVALLAASHVRQPSLNLLLKAIESMLRQKRFDMAKVLIDNTDTKHLGMTVGDPLMRSVKVVIETKNFGRDRMNFLGRQLQNLKERSRLGKSIQFFVGTIKWRAPPASLLHVTLMLFSAEASSVDREQLRCLADAMLLRTGAPTDHYLDLLIYCAHLGARANEVFNLVSSHMIFHDFRDSRYTWENNFEQEDPQEWHHAEPFFTWDQAVRNDWPGAISLATAGSYRFAGML